MKKPFLFLLVLFSCCISFAQKTLPGISVSNIGGKIIVSWKNEYSDSVVTLNIQRSYDSLQNYTTIGSVLNPTSIENGYTDQNPPYPKMYYRVFIAFVGGKYIISKPVRPFKEIIKDTTGERYAWQADQIADTAEQIHLPPVKNDIPVENNKLPAEPEFVYPSKRIFTSKMSSIVIQLPGAANKNYHVKIYDDTEKQVLELNKLKEDFLILDKMNFTHSGWYSYELFDANKLIEKGRFLVSKDIKKKNK
ncbi:MAG: hypothetical protein IPP11_10210 [Chitinophagaceae bacterium]|nr:hypothetical protein [Chitinophagaceae bacterium]